MMVAIKPFHALYILTGNTFQTIPDSLCSGSEAVYPTHMSWLSDTPTDVTTKS